MLHAESEFMYPVHSGRATDILGVIFASVESPPAAIRGSVTHKKAREETSQELKDGTQRRS